MEIEWMTLCLHYGLPWSWSCSGPRQHVEGLHMNRSGAKPRCVDSGSCGLDQHNRVALLLNAMLTRRRFYRVYPCTRINIARPPRVR